MAVCLAIYVTLMFLATHVKLKEMHLPHEELPVDKAVHFTMYLGLGFLAGAGLALSRRMSQVGRIVSWPLLVLVVILAGWAFFDELTQPMFGRTFEWLDWSADVVGIVAGLGCFQLVLNAARRRMPTVWVVSKAKHDAAEHHRKLRETIEGLAVHSI